MFSLSIMEIDVAFSRRCDLNYRHQTHPRQSFSAWVDATAQGIISARMITRMADALGADTARRPDVMELRREAAVLSAYMRESMWDVRTSTFADRRLRPTPTGPGSNVLSPTRSIAAYWTLLADVVDSVRLVPFVDALDNPELFNRPVRPPALAASHGAYSSTGGYWNGGVWPPTTYMVRGIDSVVHWDDTKCCLCARVVRHPLWSDQVY